MKFVFILMFIQDTTRNIAFPTWEWPPGMDHESWLPFQSRQAVTALEHSWFMSNGKSRYYLSLGQMIKLMNMENVIKLDCGLEIPQTAATAFPTSEPFRTFHPRIWDTKAPKDPKVGNTGLHVVEPDLQAYHKWESVEYKCRATPSAPKPCRPTS